MKFLEFGTQHMTIMFCLVLYEKNNDTKKKIRVAKYNYFRLRGAISFWQIEPLLRNRSNHICTAWQCYQNRVGAERGIDT